MAASSSRVRRTQLQNLTESLHVLSLSSFAISSTDHISKRIASQTLVVVSSISALAVLGLLAVLAVRSMLKLFQL